MGAAILFVTFVAVELAKDTRPNRQGIITTSDGGVAAMANVVRQNDLESVPSMADADLAQLLFLSFDIDGERHNPKIASSVRRATGANNTQGERPVVDIFFQGGDYSKMTISHDIKVQRQDGTSQVVDVRTAEGRQLSPWSHIGGASKPFVGLSGAGGAMVARSAWSHIG